MLACGGRLWVIEFGARKDGSGALLCVGSDHSCSEGSAWGGTCDCPLSDVQYPYGAASELSLAIVAQFVRPLFFHKS